MEYNDRIEYIKKNIIIYQSQMGYGIRSQYAICNRIQGTFPYDANIDIQYLNNLKIGDKIFINCLIPNIQYCIDYLYNYLIEKQKEEPLLQFYFLLMGEPYIPNWIIEKLYPFSIKMYLDNNTYKDPKIGYMPIGLRDGEEIHKDHKYFSGSFILDEIKQMRKKEILCLLCFSYTHLERCNCENILGKQDFILNLNNSEYNGQPSIHCGKVPILVNYEYNHKSYYTLCPSGLGEATHRFFEAIALKTIPIVKRTNTPFDKIYNFFPCLIIDEWENVTRILLEKNKSFLTEKMEEFHSKYPNFLTNPEYEFLQVE